MNLPETEVELPDEDDGPALWNPDIAGVWSVLLTPVFGSVILLRNWEAIGDAGGTKSAQRWLVASIVALVASSLVPWPGLMALAYLIVWYVAFQRKQTRYVTARWGKRYEKKRWARPLLIGVAGLFGYWVLVGALWQVLSSAVTS